ETINAPGLLSTRRERPRRNRASNHFDEVAPSHAARSGAQDHANPIQSAAVGPSPSGVLLAIRGRWGCEEHAEICYHSRACGGRGFFDRLRQEERREQANIPESLSERSDPGRGWHARHSGGLAARWGAGTTPRAARRPRQLRSDLDHSLHSTQCRPPGVGHAVWRGQQITATTANGGIGERLIGRPYLDFPAARRTQIP